LEKGKQSVFDYAYAWLKENHPEAIFSKENKNGARLLTDPHTICWVLVEENGKTVARLFVASHYDGSRGGYQGLGHQLWKASIETDANKTVIANAVDPKAGFKFCIEKAQPPGAKYPTYLLRSSRVAAPLNEFFSKMEKSEIEALCPLEDVVQILSEEEQWKCLESYLAKDTVAEIRASRETERK